MSYLQREMAAEKEKKISTFSREPMFSVLHELENLEYF